MKMRPWLLCLAIAIGSRAAVLVAGYVAVVLVGYGRTPLPPRASENELLNLPARWDSGWYVGIASGGYRWTLDAPPYERLKFFPAYPLLLRAVASPLSPERDVVIWLWSGVLVSTLLFWLALLCLFRFTADLEDRETARRTVWITASYPFGIFFGLPYTESLFLLTACATIAEYRRGRWATAVICGLSAGLTRPNGFLLSPVLMLTRRAERYLGVTSTVGRLAAILAPVAGLAVFSLYLKFTTGDFTAWMTGQPGGGSAVAPQSLLRELTASCTSIGVAACVSARAYDLLNVVAAIVALLLVIPVWRRFGSNLAAFVLLNILMPLFGIGFNCMGRYTSVLFPMFMLLAVRLKAWKFAVVVVVFTVLQWMAAGAFFTWRPVY